MAYKATFQCEFSDKSVKLDNPYFKDGKLYAHCISCRLGRKCSFEAYGRVSEKDYQKMINTLK